MKPSESVAAFEAYVETRGASLLKLTPQLGFTLLLAFYESARAEPCSGPDADMLLFQWGTYNWGEGESFELSLSRQFIEADAEGEDAISQLCLAFKYPPSSELASFGEGNRWCESLSGVQDFAHYIRSNVPYQRLATMVPPSVKLTHSYV